MSLKKKYPFLVIVKIGRERKSFSGTNEQKKTKFKVTAKYNTHKKESKSNRHRVAVQIQ